MAIPVTNPEWELKKEEAKKLIAAAGCAGIMLWSRTDAERLLPKEYKDEVYIEPDGPVSTHEWLLTAKKAAELLQKAIAMLEPQQLAGGQSAGVWRKANDKMPELYPVNATSDLHFRLDGRKVDGFFLHSRCFEYFDNGIAGYKTIEFEEFARVEYLDESLQPATTGEGDENYVFENAKGQLVQFIKPTSPNATERQEGEFAEWAIEEGYTWLPATKKWGKYIGDDDLIRPEFTAYTTPELYKQYLTTPTQ